MCDDGVPSLQGVCTLCACRTFVTYPARQQKKECESVSLLLSCYSLHVMFCSGVPTLTVGNKYAFSLARQHFISQTVFCRV